MVTVILPLEELEQLCNLSRRTHAWQPEADACLSQTIYYANKLRYVVRIEYEVEPGKVKAYLR